MFSRLTNWFLGISEPEEPTHSYQNVANISLKQVRDRVVKELGWTEDKASVIESEYRQFLLLWAIFPKAALVPWSQDLDDFWHNHILHTEQYAADCQVIEGKMLHHRPGESKLHFDNLEKTLKLRDDILKLNYYRRLVGLADLPPPPKPKPVVKAPPSKSTASSITPQQTRQYADDGVSPVPMIISSCSAPASSCPSCSGGHSSCSASSCSSGCGGGGD